ncbi:unnamed protein product [Auanema sp. JU1783]|nr:unnamed protein product [Auanema sp. JU1783]
MLITLTFCLWFGINVHADDNTSSTIANDENFLNSTRLHVATGLSTPFDEHAELAKIATSCFSSSNFEQLAGYIVRGTVARILGNVLIRESVVIIGLTELRATLNLTPLPPWQHFNDTDPSDSDLASAPTIQAYYELKEPRSVMRSLDSDYLYEANLNASISYLDKRFPSIRKIFRRRFEETRQSRVRVLDRKAIDRMIDEFSKVHEKVSRAVWLMTPKRDNKCWDAVD